MGTRAISTDAWPDQAPAADALAPDDEAVPIGIVDDEPADEPAAWTERVLTVLLAIAALGWVAAVAWRASLAFADGRPDLPALLGGVATLSTPLALIGIAYLLLRRTSRREARRFGQTAAAMRAEAASLERVLAELSGQIADNRRALGDHAHQLLLLGDDATARLAEISGAMRGESAEIARATDRLEQAARGARADMGVLLQDLPRATEESRAMAALLNEAGLGAHEQAGALAATLTGITQRGREAEEVAGGAAQRLAAHLARIEGTSAAAGERLEAAAGQMGATVDTALAGASRAVDEARRAIEAQSDATLALAEQGRVAMEHAGADAAQALSGRIAEIEARIATLAGQLAGQAETGGALVDRLDAGIGAIAARIDAFGRVGAEHNAAIDAALTALQARIEHIDGALDRGTHAADGLVTRAERLSGLLQDSDAGMRETLPQALDALEKRVGESHDALGALVPQAARLAASATDAAATLGSADALLLRQATTMRALGLAAEERLAAIQQHADRLEAAIAGSGEQVRQLVDSAGPQLIDALLRVRETALQAADHARDAFATLIPEAAGALGTAAHRALSEAIDDGIEAQMAEVAAASERAVEATQRATERLMRQMLTIADTTAVIESRLAEARAETEEADEQTFSQRVSLLIDQLNSTAINVTGLLSQEVADASWRAYLKGDRGIFTRRAVKLLTGSEVREIQRMYERDPGFHDHLNRYVHDFEAMLRRVLASREGSPLAVTLISSDMGKLYVALAQAIERLRT